MAQRLKIFRQVEESWWSMMEVLGESAIVETMVSTIEAFADIMRHQLNLPPIRPEEKKDFVSGIRRLSKVMR